MLCRLTDRLTNMCDFIGPLFDLKVGGPKYWYLGYILWLTSSLVLSHYYRNFPPFPSDGFQKRACYNSVSKAIVLCYYSLYHFLMMRNKTRFHIINMVNIVVNPDLFVLSWCMILVQMWHLINMQWGNHDFSLYWIPCYVNHLTTKCEL